MINYVNVCKMVLSFQNEFEKCEPVVVFGTAGVNCARILSNNIIVVSVVVFLSIDYF